MPDHRGHRVNRIPAQVGRRAVAGDASRDDLPAHRSLVAVDQIEPRGLGDDREVRPVRGPGEVVGADVGELLIDRGGEEDGRRPARALDDEPFEGEQHRGHPALHVARPAAIEPAALDDRPERVDRHAVGRDGVLMGVEEDRALRAGRLVPREHVVAPRRDRLPLDRDAALAEPRLEVVRDPALEEARPVERTAHRVDAGDGHEVGQQAGHGVQGKAPRGGSGGRGVAPRSYRRGPAASSVLPGRGTAARRRRGAMLVWKDDDRNVSVAASARQSLETPGRRAAAKAGIPRNRRRFPLFRRAYILESHKSPWETARPAAVPPLFDREGQPTDERVDQLTDTARRHPFGPVRPG